MRSLVVWTPGRRQYENKIGFMWCETFLITGVREEYNIKFLPRLFLSTYCKTLKMCCK